MSIQRPIITDFSAGELSPKMLGRMDLPSYGKGAQIIENFLVTSQGNLTKRGGFKHIGACYGDTNKARIIPYVYSEDEAYIIELTNSYLRIWRKKDSLEQVVVTTSAPSFSATEIWDVQVAQNHKGIFFTHPTYPPVGLIRTGQDAFTWANITFLKYPGASYASHATLNDAGNTQLVAGEGIANVNQQGILRVKFATGQHDEYTYTSWEGTTFGGLMPAIARDYDGDDTIIIGHEYDSDGATTPFSGANNYPRSIAIFEGRFYFGGSNLDRQRWWASRPYSDIYDGNILTLDMRMTDIFITRREEQTPATEWADPAVPETETVVYTRAVISDASAMQADLGSDMNDAILSMAPARDLVVMTTSAEWNIPAGITARTPAAKLQSRVGSSNIQPQFIWNFLAFLQSSNKQLRAYTYSQEEGGYKPPDLTRVADHILGAGGAVQMGFQQEPRCLLFLPRSDGELAVLTYEPDAGVLAWQRWKHADGTFISIAVIPESGVDEVYAVVYRNSKYYIEKCTDPFPATQAALNLMDASYDITGDPLSLVTDLSLAGATWLAGETVTVYEDGVEGSTTQAIDGSGNADLSTFDGAQVTIGLPYTHKLETPPIRGIDAAGSMAMKPKRIVTAYFRLYRSMTLKVIADSWTVALADDYALGNTWITDDVEVPFPGPTDRNSALRVVGKDALPLTILALSMEVVAGD